MNKILLEIFELMVIGLLVGVLSSCASQNQAPAQDARPASVAASELPFVAAVVALNFEDFEATLSGQDVGRLLGGALQNYPVAERRAAATLVSMGAFQATDLTDLTDVDTLSLQNRVAKFVEITNSGHPALMGRIGDTGLLARLSRPLNHDYLLSATTEIEALGEALSSGVITGYDLRAGGIYDGFPPGETFIYSHSDLLHVRQLVALMHREGLNAWLYVTPKVSAFLYRDEWGGIGDNLVTLASGIKVVQGREMAVMFRFDSPADRRQFRDLVTRFAKRDSKEETGLIASAWWQPFYYSDRPLRADSADGATGSDPEADFEQISLVVLRNDRFEATLTVVNDKVAAVVDEVLSGPWQLRTDKVWVNPAFYRFLGGGYK